jgi:hypothetical protein
MADLIYGVILGLLEIIFMIEGQSYTKKYVSG